MSFFSNIPAISYNIQKEIRVYNQLIYGYKMDLSSLLEFLKNIDINESNKENIDNIAENDFSQLSLDSALNSYTKLPFKFERVQQGVIIYPYDFSLYFHSDPNQYYMREFNINLIYSDIDINEYTSRLKMEYTREFIYFLENNGYDFIANNLRWHLVSKIFVD